MSDLIYGPNYGTAFSEIAVLESVENDRLIFIETYDDKGIPNSRIPFKPDEAAKLGVAILEWANKRGAESAIKFLDKEKVVSTISASASKKPHRIEYDVFLGRQVQVVNVVVDEGDGEYISDFKTKEYHLPIYVFQNKVLHQSALGGGSQGVLDKAEIGDYMALTLDENYRVVEVKEWKWGLSPYQSDLYKISE